MTILLHLNKQDFIQASLCVSSNKIHQLLMIILVLQDDVSSSSESSMSDFSEDEAKDMEL